MCLGASRGPPGPQPDRARRRHDTPRTQPDPNPVSDGRRPHQMAGRPRTNRQAVGGGRSSDVSEKRRRAPFPLDNRGIEMRTQAPLTVERPAHSEQRHRIDVGIGSGPALPSNSCQATWIWTRSAIRRKCRPVPRSVVAWRMNSGARSHSCRLRTQSTCGGPLRPPRRLTRRFRVLVITPHDRQSIRAAQQKLSSTRAPSGSVRKICQMPLSARGLVSKRWPAARSRCSKAGRSCALKAK